jgi:hypothetical protein
MPGQPVVLDSFGGLVTTTRPEDSPEGASPRNNDVDFIVGRFIQRPGCQSVYTLAQAQYGPNGGASATVIDTILSSWVNPANILLDNETYATTTLAGPSAANYAVQSMAITTGGYYTPSETPVAELSGFGAGAIFSFSVGTITPAVGDPYNTVTGVTVLTGGIYTGPVAINFSGASAGNNAAVSVTMQPLASTLALSNILQVTGFSLPITATYQINGIGVNVRGFAPSGATVFAQLLKAGVPVGDVESLALPATNGYVALGSPIDLWLTTWLNTDTDSPGFGVNLWVGSESASTVSLDYVEIVVYGKPKSANFNGIGSVNLNQTDQTTLTIDANGLTWKEDASNNPGILYLETGIPDVMVDSFLKAIDANGVAFMAYSDLTQGTSQPMQYNGAWCDRITQVGPGVAPNFTPQQTSTNSFAVTLIKQPAQMSDPADYGHINVLQQSAGPSSTAPGNTVTVFYANSQYYPLDSDLVDAYNSGNPVYVYVSGTSLAAANGTFLVTGIGNSIPPGGAYYRWYFTFQVASTAYQQFGGPDDSPGYYQRTLATMIVATPVPGLTVGNQVTISGNSNSNYNAQWTITQALNSGASRITATSVTGGVATYQYSLQSGQPPVAGELVTVTNTTNALGALNVTQATIASSTAYGGTVNTTGTAVTLVSGNDFSSLTNGQAITINSVGYTISTVNSPTSITLSSSAGTLSGAVYTAGTLNVGSFTVLVPITATYGSTPEPTNASATTAGTVFTFDPGALVVGTSTNPIYGSGHGGSFIFVSAASQVITSGVRQGSVFFITRNGAVTRPAPPVQFTVPENCGAIIANQVPIGPENVVARGITFTESGQNQVAGANFYYYDTAQTYYVNGIKYTSDALIIPDNTSTSATFSFSDAVLFASDEIDIPGNDYFNLIELGNPAWIFQYANRMLYGLCQTKIQNFLNMSFDGGYLPTGSSALPMPTGWNAPSTNPSMGLVQSLDFGNAFQIVNPNDSAWTNAQVLYQSAFQDYLNVNIIQPNTSYSVRVKARSIYADGQTVTLQLPTYANGAFSPTVSGSASFTLNQGNYEIQSAPLITGNGLATVPTALQIALGVSALSVGAGVEIDRIEIFPTNRPVDTTTIWTSYAGKFESVDINTGTLGVGADNAQAATGAFEILEQLYIEKSKSLCVTQDSPNYEPNNWQVRQASDRAGAVGPNAFDEGEEFAVSASRNGVYYFDGGKPQPILRELQNSAKGLNLWESINWEAGATIWIRNDLNNRRLMIGIPMITPNPWLPNAAASTPISPNIILMCNYTGCPTGAELAESSEVHVTMFGDLKALDMRRKWSLWQIPCPVAEFVPRTDGFTTPLFLCNGNASGKIYQLLPGAADGSGQNDDDGAAINWSYCTCGFVKGKAGQQVQGLGALRKIAYYFTATMEGIGQVAGKLYANSLGALGRNTFTIPLPFTLSSPQQNDQERTLEFGAQRIFVEFSSIGSGGYAEIGSVTLDMDADKNSPHRGVSS